MLPARHRMRRSADFATAIRRGRRVARSTLVVHLVVLAECDEPPLVGFVVNRAVGSAVVRNTVRRRLRHLMRERLGGLPPGSLLVVRALPSASKVSSADLARDLDAALEQATARPRHLQARRAS